MLSSSLDTMLKVSKATSPQKLFRYNYVMLYLKIHGKYNSGLWIWPFFFTDPDSDFETFWIHIQFA